MYATGRRHLRISKLYLTALLKRAPNIFVALAWSQAFWLILEATAGNDDSHGYVRLSSVVCYALALHTGGHLLLHRYSSGRRKLSHHALEFLLDLVTEVVGFSWINVAEEMLAQVFEVRAKTTLVYATLAFAASLGAMEVGSLARSLVGWSVEFEETANQFDAGSFALPTSWLITQGVHIALYGFFYRTGGGQGGRGGGRGGGEDGVVDIRLAASLFLLAYALLCSALATRVIGGTVAASAIAVGGGNGSGGTGDSSDGLADSGGGGSSDSTSSRSEFVIRAISSYEVTAAQASDVGVVSSTPRRCAGYNTLYREAEDGGDDEGVVHASSGDGGEHGAASLAAMALLAAATAAVDAGASRRNSLRRGLKAYMRLTVGMMVGWAYNLWGQVEFRQEELEFRFGPALGAAAYAALSTILGVCIMVRGADKLAASSSSSSRKRTSKGDSSWAAAPAGAALNDDSGGCHLDERLEEEEAKRHEDALRSYHARRLLVVVGGVSLVVGWAWEEAFDLMLEGLLGDEADASTIAAKLGLAVLSTAVVLGREIRRAARHEHHPGGDGYGSHHHLDAGGSFGRVAEEGLPGDGDLLEPLVATNERNTAVL